MARELEVVPPAPKRRLVMRRVKAYRFAWATVFSGVPAVVSAPLGLDALVERQFGPSFWFVTFLFGVMLVCALVALYFSFTEEPKEVEILERSTPPNVIHVSEKHEA